MYTGGNRLQVRNGPPDSESTAADGTDRQPRGAVGRRRLGSSGALNSKFRAHPLSDPVPELPLRGCRAQRTGHDEARIIDIELECKKLNFAKGA